MKTTKTLTQFLYTSFINTNSRSTGFEQEELELFEYTYSYISEMDDVNNIEETTKDSVGENFMGFEDIPENTLAALALYEIAKGVIKHLAIPISEYYLKKLVEEKLKKYEDKLDLKLITLIQKNILKWLSDYVTKK